MHSILSGIAFIVILFLCKNLRKGFDKMLDLYVGLVVAGRRTCNPENKKVRLVPKIWRDLVIEDLKALGLDLDGKPVEVTGE